jgi:hypothetical protein
MSNDSQLPALDELSREELYTEECKRIDELFATSSAMQTILATAPPIEPAGSHIDRRNERIDAHLKHAKTLVDTLEQLHSEMKHR